MIPEILACLLIALVADTPDLFLGTAQPPVPDPATFPCGEDPDPPGSRGDLGCEDYAGCQLVTP